MDELKKLFDKIQEEKNMDSITEIIMLIIVQSGLNMKEVAAVNFYIAQRTLKEPHNKLFLKEKLNLDTDNLSVGAVFSIQQILTTNYIEEIMKGVE